MNSIAHILRYLYTWQAFTWWGFCLGLGVALASFLVAMVAPDQYASLTLNGLTGVSLAAALILPLFSSAPAARSLLANRAFAFAPSSQLSTGLALLTQALFIAAAASAYAVLVGFEISLTFARTFIAASAFQAFSQWALCSRHLLGVVFASSFCGAGFAASFTGLLQAGWFSGVPLLFGFICCITAWICTLV